MTEYAMPPETVRTLMTALQRNGVAACISGGWAVDALIGKQTREHQDLDIWVDAGDFEGLVATLADQGVDRLHPWPGDRPWNFVLHDGRSRRIDLHLYETLTDEQLRYGSHKEPFLFTRKDLSATGQIAGITVQCEHPEFALQNHTGYEPRPSDHHDVALLCDHFKLPPPENFR